MVKRIKTPPPPEDEPRYLTVVHPYPLHANLELHADRRTLALWLACCTGKDVLLAMFHKPASPGMVVIEVDRDFDRFNDLLGSHAWSGFLLRPTNEQNDKSSKVFYCTYNTGRLVEKNGWKRVNIEEHWFNGWTANNSIISYPYPKTSYCDVPSEAMTGAPMCRALPQRSFPVPPPPPAPVVGSAGWLAARSANPSASPAPSSTRKGKKAAPSDTASVTSAGSRSSRAFSPPPAPSPAPSSVMANYRAKNDVAWKRGPPSVSSVSSAVTSRAPSTVGGSSSAMSSRAAAALPAPPGLGPRLTPQSRAPERFNWSEDVERFEAEQANNPPARSSAPSLSSNSARRQPPDPDGPIEPSRDYEYNEEDQPRHSTVAALSDVFDVDDSAPAPSVRNGRGGTRPPGLDDPDYDPWNPPAEVAAPASDQSRAGEPATLWEAYDAPRMELPIKKKKGTWMCPQHGSICSPGICKDRARHEREERMKINQEKWKRERMERDEKRARNQKKREAAAAMGERRGNASSSSSSSSGSDNGTPRDRDSSAPPQPDQEEWPIDWKAGGADAQSTVSSVRPAWDSVSGSVYNDDDDDDDDDDDNDDDDGGVNVVSLRTTTTNSVVSRSSRAAPPASVSSSGRNKGPTPSATPSRGNMVPTQDSPTSVRHARASVVRSVSDDDDGVVSVASVRTTNTSGVISRSSSVAPPASVSSSGRNKGSTPSATPSRGNMAQAQISPTSPRPATRQPAWDARSAASQSTSAGKVNDWLSLSGNNQPSVVSAASATGSGTDQRSKTGPATRQSTRNSASSSARTDAGPLTPSTSSVANGFPTYADTEWGDPIAAALAKAGKGGSRKGSGEEGSAGGGQKASKSSRKRKNKARTAQVQVQAQAQAAQASTVEAGLDVELAPGGPGSSWGDPNEVW